MKVSYSISLIFLSLCFIPVISSQTKGVFEYTFLMNFGDMVYMKPTSKASLHYEKDQSLFTYKRATPLPGDKNQISDRQYFADFFPGGCLMDRMDYDSIGFMVYYNCATDSLLSRERLDGSLYMVVDTLERPKWILIDSTKEIHKILCKKATTYFRGRNYIAWYSIEHQVPFGPWKFVGLPGLVIEVKTNNGELGFILKKIDFESEPDVFKPQGIPRIGHEKFWQYYLNERMKTIERVLKAREKRLLPNGEYRFIFEIPEYHTTLEILGDWSGKLDHTLYEYSKI